MHISNLHRKKYISRLTEQKKKSFTREDEKKKGKRLEINTC